jgi:hypothetical protein
MRSPPPPLALAPAGSSTRVPGGRTRVTSNPSPELPGDECSAPGQVRMSATVQRATPHGDRPARRPAACIAGAQVRASTGSDPGGLSPECACVSPERYGAILTWLWVVILTAVA